MQLCLDQDSDLREYPADETAPGAARRAVEQYCSTHGLDALTDAAKAAVSELVTNAVKHGEPIKTPSGGKVIVLITKDAQRMRVETYDGSPTGLPDQAALADDLSECGRGLWLVNCIACKWGSQREPCGKSVWFELER